jgi:uncharacterized protein involved in exopolysaccharide biosynthesis/Mrp family chromosome partitioning ATPase
MTAPMGLLPGPAAPEELRQAPPPALGPLLLALLRSRRLVAALCVSGGLVGLLAGLMRPNSYTSTGTLLLRSGARETETAESAVAGRDPRDVRPFEVLANEIEILSHRDTFRRVVEKVGVDRILEVYDPAGEDTADTSWLSRALHGLQSWWFQSSSRELAAATPQRREFLALQTLMRHLGLAPVGSSMIRVDYDAHTPALAKEVTDAFLAAAEEHHRQVFSNRTSLDFLTSVEQKARASAAAADAAMLAFKDEHDIFDLAFQRTRLMADLAELQTQQTAGQEALAACERRCEAVRAMLADVPPFEDVPADTPPIPNPEYVALLEQLTALRAQEVAARAGADRAEMQRSLAAVATLVKEVEQRLRNVAPTLPGPKGTQALRNPRYDRLRAQLDVDEPRAVELRAADEGRRGRMAKLRARLEELDKIAARHARLQEDVQKHEADRKRFVESRQKFELLNLLDEHKLSNLEILEAGDLPVEKSGPRRGMWAISGAVLGLLLGLCLALARHRFGSQVHGAQDLEAAGVDVLGVVPETKGFGSRASAPELPVRTHDQRLRQRWNGAWGALLPRLREARATIAIVGDEHSPGGSTLALYFALRFVRSLHRDVLLVEANWHHPTLAARLGLDQDAPGFFDLVAGTSTRAEVVKPTSVAGMRVVCAGSPGSSSAGLHARKRPEEALRALVEGFSIVLLDVPSIVAHPEFQPLVWCADTVVPVFAAGSSTKGGARALCAAIDAAGGRSPGAILNRWRSARPFWLPRSLDI